MVNVFGEVKFKPLVRYQKVIPNYFVSEDGRAWNSKTDKFLKPSVSEATRADGTKKPAKYRWDVNFKKGLFPDYVHRHKKNMPKDILSMTIGCHRAVAETWMPVDDFPPATVAPFWNDLPEPVKQWIRDTAVVDHIDDNPANNHVDNLRWVTPKENEYNRKKHEFAKLSGKGSENTIDGGDA